ncbi:MAG: PrgI family protein [Candidatus Wildermuthbacteria bacterium]|nr:PrgI family protein [Candidatus Wildermuthbacteria bacterium]
MQFQIPQFIEREAKVIGPLTFRQFIYIAIPGAVAFFFYFTAPFAVFVAATAILGLIGFALAFMKTGGRSFPELLVSALRFGMSPKTYIWKKEKAKTKPDVAAYAPPPLEEGGIATKVVLVQKSKVKDLATKVETKQ